MSDKKISLDEILKEYPSDRSKVKYSRFAVPEAPKSRIDTEAMLDTIEGEEASEKNEAMEEQNEKIRSRIISEAVKKTGDEKFEQSADDIVEKIKHSRREERQKESEQAPNPSKNYSPDSLLRSRISFVNAIRERKVTKEDEISEGYEGVVSVSDEDEDKLPKIRKMSDSTRAKELEKHKKHKGSKGKLNGNYGYKKESPVGLYVNDTVRNDGRKKHKKKSEDEGKYNPFSKKELNVKFEDEAPSEKTDDARFDVRSFSHEGTDGSILDVPIDKKEIKRQRKIEKEEKASHDKNKREIKHEIRQLKNAVVSRTIALFILVILGIAISCGKHFHFSYYNMLGRTIGDAGVFIVYAVFGIIASAIAFPTVKYGLKRLFTWRSDCDTMAAVSIAASIISSVLAAFSPNLLSAGYIHAFVPVAILILAVNSVGKLYILNRAEKNVKFISEGYNWYAADIVENEANAFSLTRGVLNKYPVLMTLRKANKISDFLKYTYSADIADKYARVSSPLCVIVSLIMTAAAVFFEHKKYGVVENISFGFSIFTSMILLTSCLGISLVVNIPLLEVAKKFSGRDGAIFGYQGVEDFYDTNSCLLDASKIFPSSSVTLRGIKIVSDIQIEENLFAAASLANSCNSIVKESLSAEVINNPNRFYDVTNFKYEDKIGISGWINNKRVLFGSRELMKNHNIEEVLSSENEAGLTENGRYKAVYLAVSGNLSAIFLFEFTRSKKVEQYLSDLRRNGIKVVLKTVDFMVNPALLEKLYGAKDMVKVLPESAISVYDEETKPGENISASVIMSGRLSSTVRILTGIKKIKKSAKAGVSVQLISALLGAIIGSVYVLTKTYSSLSAYMILIFQVIFLLISAVVCRIKKL